MTSIKMVGIETFISAIRSGLRSTHTSFLCNLNIHSKSNPNLSLLAIEYLNKREINSRSPSLRGDNSIWHRDAVFIDKGWLGLLDCLSCLSCHKHVAHVGAIFENGVNVGSAEQQQQQQLKF